jgi:hypothetical protein
MPPIPPPSTPRIVLYYQTHHNPDGAPISILPIITQPEIAVTHVILAAIHLNDPPGNITLVRPRPLSPPQSRASKLIPHPQNDDAPSNPRYLTLWAELRVLQASGVKVLGMLGGAAKGSFTRLDIASPLFESYYIPLRDLIRARGLDGLDLDVEEPMTLVGIIRLIDRLRSDFGSEFMITLAPVAAALLSENPGHNLSGFSYEALEVMRGKDIGWYNAQFYCGWGDMGRTEGYEFMVARGWPQEKIVVGLVTNPGNGSGWVPFEVLGGVLGKLRERYPRFGGVMGWEYFNSLPGGKTRPWEWARFMTGVLRGMKTPEELPTLEDAPPVASAAVEKPIPLLLADVDTMTEEASLPDEFEYYSDGSLGE